MELRFGEFEIAKPLVLWINDGLMAIFFFLVGLEIKSELVEGALSSPDRAVLPLAAALGGMAMPAAIYISITWSDPSALSGWAVPTATDIAFAIGILGLLGRRVPPTLKAFLLALAVLDDVGAVTIIALFYTNELSTTSLAFAAVFITALAVLNRLNVMRGAAYVLVGIALWTCVLKSGVHATLAGVVTAIFVPIRRLEGEDGPLRALRDDLQWPVSLGIVPLFAFANAGVPLHGVDVDALTTGLSAGVILGLVIGKPFGIIAGVAGAVSFGVARRPAGTHWMHMLGVGCLGGIGFTMSLFIGTLAFGSTAAMEQVRLGVLVGSTLSAVIGVTVLVLAARREKT